MAKYIRDNMLSVGFNPSSGQLFFDTLLIYQKYIKEYFFDISNGFNGLKYDPKVMINRIKQYDTYAIPANLLFNNHHSFISYRDKIEALNGIVNLRAVTILNPEDAKTMKDSYPDIEVHLSTRFWDWGRFKNPINTLNNVVNNGCIDVVNISSPYSSNDYELIQMIHQLGMKVKYIANDGCIINKDSNYSKFNNFRDCVCRPNPFSESACQCTCYEVTNEIPWIELCKSFLYKESLHFYHGNIDIIKISGRHRSIDYIIKYLDYWTSDKLSDHIIMSYHHDLPIGDKYDIFLEYLDTKSKCAGNCWNCRKCEKYYKIISNK